MAKREKRGKTRKNIARVSTHELFNESDTLRSLAQDILGRFDGTPEEEASLKKFLKRLDKIQEYIGELCQVIKGGNPMFHDFKIKPRR